VTYDNRNKGVMFKNDQGDNPKRPNYRGSVNVEGVEYNLSAWVRESQKTGDKFLSLSIEKKGERNFKPKEKAAPQTSSQPDFDDPLPF